jgi:hypothetical protein
MEDNQYTNRHQTLALSTEQAGGAGRGEGSSCRSVARLGELEIGSHDPGVVGVHNTIRDARLTSIPLKNSNLTLDHNSEDCRQP